MKSLFFTLCLFFIVSFPVWGQDSDAIEFLSPSENLSNHDYGRLAMTHGVNSIELGFGMPQFIADIMDVDMFNNDDLDMSVVGMMEHEWFQDEYVLTRRLCTWALNASYRRSVKWWLQLGASLTTGVYKADYEKGYTRDHSFTEKSVVVNCVPAVRFNFRNRKYFGLYSEVGVGLYFLHEENYHYRNSFRCSSGNKLSIMGQLTLLGVRLGSKVYAYGEFGVGPKGLFNAGVGYKF